MGINKRKTGDVVDKEGNPYSFAIIRVYIAGTDTQISQKVTSKTGQYYCLVQNGSYYITVEKKNGDESYTLVHKSEIFEAKHGILNGKIIIDENKPILPTIQPIQNTPMS
jgi:flagellar basal body rod protein FlgF